MEIEEDVPVTPPGLRACCLQSESGECREHYELGYLEVGTEDGVAICYVIPILVQEDKPLVAVPAQAWSRTASGRYLPKGTLTKAVLLEVAAAEEEIEGFGGEVVKIWMGFLSAEAEGTFQVGEAEEPGACGFGDGSNERMPAPEALLSVAAEHFAFQTAQSAVEPTAKPGAKKKTKADMEKRVLQLENSLEDIKALLTDLPKQIQNTSGVNPASAAQSSTALPLGLDPGVVAAAKAAGVPEEQIRKIGGMMQKPNRMVEVIGGGGAPRRRNELSETEEEEEEQVQPEEKGVAATGAVEKAVVQLTKLVAKMAKTKHAKSGLEGILERAESGGAGLEGGVSSSSGGRSKAAAYVKLKEALLKHPNWISQSIEQQMEEDFNSVRSQPGAGAVLTTSRAWVEHRSRLGPYPSTIRAAWLIAGIHDSLKQQDDGASSCEMLLSISSYRPGCHRCRKLDAGSRISSRASTSLQRLCPEEEPGPCRAAVFASSRRQILGGDDVEAERSRQLPRIQEEVEPAPQVARNQPRRRPTRPSSQAKAETEEPPKRAAAGCPEDRGDSVEGGPAPEAVRVPGARASRVRGGIWDLCFTTLTRMRTGLSAFLHSILQACGPKKRPPQGRRWPMPLPYPEVHRGARRGASSEVQLKLGSNLLDICLGTPLNRVQWQIVRSLTPLVKTWNQQDAVGPVEMGRAAAKVESVEAVIAALEEAAVQQATGLSSYSSKSRTSRCGWGQNGHPGEVVGQLSAEVEHVAKDVEPHRLRFVDEPAFDASQFLDEENKQKFLRPLDFARDPDQYAVLPRVKIRASRENKLKLLETLDSSGRLDLLPEESIAKGFENGLFSIPKDGARDRMVLDARRANSREVAEKRWIYSLGSTGQLNHLFLDEDEELFLHCEDLREYYHCFRVSRQRVARNALKMAVTPKQVEKLKCFREELRKHSKLVPCLATLAMGDLNAVAFGQAAHLAVILRGSRLQLSDFMALKLRPSRNSIRAGLMIDDFVLFETLKKDEADRVKAGQRSRGRDIVDEVRRAYTAAKLPRHDGKAVEQSVEAECWGLHIDGAKGVARPNLKRVIPLANILLRMLNCGRASVGLLEVVSGALCSVFQARRRLMSMMHEIYEAQKGRQRSEIVQLSSHLRDELMMSIPLLMTAVVDFRLRPSSSLIATDASSVAEASVRAEVGEQRTREFQRFGLQKGLWNRLLSPGKALIRAKCAEEVEDEELPEEQYEMHPIWQEVTECVDFKQDGPVKTSDKKEHINLKELNAALTAEKRQGEKEPGTYYVHLQDSQVSLACLVKGRSSSWAINRKLRGSIPHHLGNNCRPFYGFVRSKLNPADDPTRGVELRRASKVAAGWYQDLEQGDNRRLDEFLEQKEMGILDMADLPSEDELLQPWEFDVKTSKELKRERGRRGRNRGCRGGAEEGGEAEAEIAEAEKVASSVESSKPYCSAQAEGRCAEQSGVLTAEAGGLHQEAVEILLSLPSSQFVLRKGVKSVAEALKLGPGVLDLFSGARGFAKAVVRRGAPWALCWDLKHSTLEDVLKPPNKRILSSLLRLGAVSAMAAGPVCASFSTAITPCWRNRQYPGGIPGLKEDQLEKIRLGHEQLQLVLALCKICLKQGIHFWVENPDGSWFWKQQGDLSWDSLLASGKIDDYRVDQCRHGTPWRKRTRFRTTTHLGGVKQLCDCTQAHVQLRGRCKAAGMNYTKLAESYPRSLCDFLACAVALDCKWQTKHQRVSPSAMARALHCRIGEAQNPGPRIQREPRRGSLLDVQVLEPQTVQLRSKIWKHFSDWLDNRVGQGSLSNLLEVPLLFVKCLEGFGLEQYQTGAPLHYFRQLLAHVQKEFVYL